MSLCEDSRISNKRNHEESKMFELTYIHHDCFLLRTSGLGIVFDYWFDPTAPDDIIPPFVKDCPTDLPLYVLVSHFHKDHFNKNIFRWADSHPDIRFVLSRDVARKVRYMLNPDSTYSGMKIDSSRVTILSKLDIYSDDLLTIQAFGSTDVGNSYALTLRESGLKVFHAGDLNCWSWRDESTDEEIRAAEQAYVSELRPIADAFPEFDVVMFPVDSRIGTGFNEGARIFTRCIDVKRFFPMHFTLADSELMQEQRRLDAIDFSAYAPERGEFIGLTDPYDKYSDEESQLLADADIESKKVYSQSWFLSAGDANAEREMSLPLLTAKLIEIATSHANEIGIGNPFMPNNHCGWVLSRLAIEMTDYPLVDSTFKIDTWVETWNRHYSERDFCIMDSSGSACGYARSIWMVLDTETHSNAGLDTLPFREEYLSDKPCPICRQGKHMLLKMPDEILQGDRHVIAADPNPAVYTFGYSNLDAYRHVNTVRYVSLLMNQFALSVHDKFRVRRIELSFIDEGAYGMSVEILRAQISSPDKDGNESTLLMLRDISDHHPIVYARIDLEARDKPIASL